MARVTVEDCLEHVENRFKLVLLASKRARQLTLGTEPLVEWENDKPTVVALREIAENLVNEEMMQASLATPFEEEVEFDEDDLAAALHAEISRELSQTAPEPAVTETPKPQEQPAPEPAVTETPKPQEQPAPASSNPFLSGELNSDTSDSLPATNAKEEALPSFDADPEPPPSASNNPLFGGGFSPDINQSPPATDVQDETSPSVDPAADSPPTDDPSSEGEQGF